MIIIGLGTVWILDGLEVTVISSITGRVSATGSGVSITSAQISGFGAAVYVLGACVGALFFGQLTDRFGRKRLFMITLAFYLSGAVLTAFSFAPWWFFIFRFITGAGIGGEYSAINSAIDELIEKEHRGRVDIAINGSYWLGAIGGALLSVLVLNESIFPVWLGWRLAFGLGGVLGLIILFVHRNVPESPRWLLIHGHQDEAERIVGDIERRVTAERGKLSDVPEDRAITIRQRRSIPLTEMFRTFDQALSEALDPGVLLVRRAGIPLQLDPLRVHHRPGHLLRGGRQPVGPFVLGPLFDSIGRKQMISTTYLLSGILLLITGLLFQHHVLTATTLTVAWMVVFFFASAGTSAAYLTVSEVFPMETRAISISVFYAIGTGAGGIIGPLLFAKMVATKNATDVFWALALGAALMIAGGIVESILGVRAERKGPEEIAMPLTAADAEAEAGSGPAGRAEGGAAGALVRT